MTTPHSTGDQGQRYMLQAYGYPTAGTWSNVLYTNSRIDVQHAADGILLAPSCEVAHITDRQTGQGWTVRDNPEKDASKKSNGAS